MNNLIAFGLENKPFSLLEKQKDCELEETLNSIPSRKVITMV